MNSRPKWKSDGFMGYLDPQEIRFQINEVKLNSLMHIGVARKVGLLGLRQKTVPTFYINLFLGDDESINQYAFVEGI